ncbi:flagellar biosynthetic protein FliO [Micrococcaceae bacterium Sec5.8]
MDALILGLRVFVALGAVLGLMWLLQRRLVKGTGRRRTDSALKIVSRQSIGQKASVVVVDASGQRFLLGVTDHAVNVLHTGDIPAEAVKEAPPESRRAAGEFARVLAGFNPLPGRDPGVAEMAADRVDEVAAAPADTPLPRRSTRHRVSHARGPAPRAKTSGAAGHAPLHGSILAGSTWKQAAAALRSGRRN